MLHALHITLLIQLRSIQTLQKIVTDDTVGLFSYNYTRFFLSLYQDCDFNASAVSFILSPYRLLHVEKK